MYAKIVDIEYCIPDGEFKDEYVYDIEVEADVPEDHTFFGNDILVHNSLFFSLDPVVKSCEWDDSRTERDIIFELSDKFLKDFHKEILEDFSKKYHVDNIQDFELEKYCESILFLAKKKYIAHVSWADGVGDMERLSDKSIYAKGVDIVRSTTPKLIRDKVKELIKWFFDNPSQNTNATVLLTKKIKVIRDIFNSYIKPDTIDDICLTGKCNNYEKYVLNDTEFLQLAKGTPISVRASAIYNYNLNKNPLLKKKYTPIKNGDKFKYYFTKDKTDNIFAFNGGSYPYEFAPEIDSDMQFKKTFLSIVNRFCEALNIPEYNNRITTIVSLF